MGCFIVTTFAVSCSNKISYDDNYYHLEFIDSTFFEDLNLFLFSSKNDSNIYIISKKDYTLKDSVFFLRYTKLSRGLYYYLEFKSIDTTVTAKVKFAPTRQPEMYVDMGREIIWELDTFRVKLFNCSDIIGSYILKDKTILFDFER